MILILLNFCNQKCFEQMLNRKSKHTFYVQKPFFRKSCWLQDNRDKHGMLDWPQMTIWSIHFTWWITKATDIHSEYLMYCFSTATRLRPHTSTFHLYIQSCLVYLGFEVKCRQIPWRNSEFVCFIAQIIIWWPMKTDSMCKNTFGNNFIILSIILSI